MSKALKSIEREKLFAAALPAMGFNAEAAAISVGIKPGPGARVSAYRLLTKANVQRMVSEHVAAAIKRSSRSLDAIIAELELLGFSNMADYTRIGMDGDRYIDTEQCTRNQMAAVHEIVVENYTEGHGDNAQAVKKTRLRLHDKQKSLVTLLQYHTVGAKGLTTGDGTTIFNIQNNNTQINIEQQADGYRAALEGN